MARPRIVLDDGQVSKLAKLGCTIKEIAEFFGVSEDTIERRFAVEIDKGRAELKIRLRRLQLRAAEQGNISMLIFLGKVLLGQRQDGDPEKPAKIEVIIACSEDEDGGKDPPALL